MFLLKPDNLMKNYDNDNKENNSKNIDINNNDNNND